MRPIDADALKEALLVERDKIPLEVVERYSFGFPSPNRHGQAMRGGIRKALRCMENTPTLDLAPIKQADWLEHGCSTFCTRCGEKPLYDYFGKLKLSNYCPNCGAKMDGGKSNA